jgi:hypothetical protein
VSSSTVHISRGWNYRFSALQHAEIRPDAKTPKLDDIPASVRHAVYPDCKSAFEAAVKASGDGGGGGAATGGASTSALVTTSPRVGFGTRAEVEMKARFDLFISVPTIAQLQVETGKRCSEEAKVAKEETKEEGEQEETKEGEKEEELKVGDLVKLRPGVELNDGYRENGMGRDQTGVVLKIGATVKVQFGDPPNLKLWPYAKHSKKNAAGEVEFVFSKFLQRCVRATEAEEESNAKAEQEETKEEDAEERMYAGGEAVTIWCNSKLASR